MNPELIEKIQQFSLNEAITKKTIENFLSYGISANLYNEVEGEEIKDKIETIYNYLHNIVKRLEIKQPLNVVIADDASSLDYVAYLKQKFDVTVHKVNDVKNPKDIDLVLFTGGEDVNPTYYNESVGKYTYININRDLIESDTFYKFKNHCLLLGICRGSQMLTILSGGRLIQHVEGHSRDHSMILKNGLKYNITSSHHQMLYPFDLNKKDYELIAYSEYFQSKTYLNGNNEEIELSTDFLEPEIVYYKNTNSLCIQGHPEWSHCERRTSQMCLNLIDKYLQEFKNDQKTRNPIHNIFSIPVKDYSDEEYNKKEYNDCYEEDGYNWEPVKEEESTLL